jgi:hypothetical protein
MTAARPTDPLAMKFDLQTKRLKLTLMLRVHVAVSYVSTSVAPCNSQFDTVPFCRHALVGTWNSAKRKRRYTGLAVFCITAA